MDNNERSGIPQGLNIVEELQKKGMRISIEAEVFLKENERKKDLLEKIISLKKTFIEKKDIEEMFKNLEEEKLEIVVNRQASFRPIAKEYESKIEVLHKKEVTGKSTTTGGVEDFVNYFQDRYRKLSVLIRKTTSKYPKVSIGEVKKSLNDKVTLIVIITNIQKTKKGNILVEIEDLTGQFKAVLSMNDDKLKKKAECLLLDDIVALEGKVLDAFLIVEDVNWPDLPVTRERKYSENDLAVAYLSDIHFGSKYFIEEYLERFIDWVNGRSGAQELASKLKYITIAGDIADGIGVYPNQEKELVVLDVYKQYKLFDDFVSRLPDYITVIITPGNHDAVRRGEPMPAMGKDLVQSEVVSLGNPSSVVIEGLKHLLYHGTSMDSMISALGYLSYKKPEKVMEEFLKRRHLSPIYGGNLIIPEKVDYLVIDDEPDVMHVGHIHKNGYGYYRGTLLINSGTFQARTEFQIKQGHIPTPGLVPVYEMKNGRLKTLDLTVS